MRNFRKQAEKQRTIKQEEEKRSTLDEDQLAVKDEQMHGQAQYQIGGGRKEEEKKFRGLFVWIRTRLFSTCS